MHDCNIWTIDSRISLSWWLLCIVGCLEFYNVEALCKDMGRFITKCDGQDV